MSHLRVGASKNSYEKIGVINTWSALDENPSIYQSFRFDNSSNPDRMSKSSSVI